LEPDVHVSTVSKSATCHGTAVHEALGTDRVEVRPRETALAVAAKVRLSRSCVLRVAAVTVWPLVHVVGVVQAIAAP